MQIAYKPGTAFFHQIDPLTKFLWILIVSFWLYSLREITSVLVVCFVITVFSFWSARMKVKQYLRLSLVVFTGGWALLIYQGLVRPGIGIVVGPVTLSYEGMSIGLALALRSFGLIASGIAFSITTSPQDLELSLEKIGIPYRIARISYLALRLIPIFQRDYQSIEDVQTLRGAKKGLQRYNTSLKALLATELRLVDTISIALETRGFGIYKKRTNLKEVRVGAKGTVLVSCTFVLMILQLFILK